MSTEKPLVLVTGVSGFLGSHVVYQLLEAGYSVRGTARSSKVELTREGYASYGNKYEVVALDDLIAGNLTDALRGVGAVIHVASPLPGAAGAEETLNTATEGTLNIIRQAEKAGIRKFAVVSSIATVRNAENSTGLRMMSEDDWNPVTREEALAGADNAFLVYRASKTLAEKALWVFARQHPHVDITTVNPPFLYGPFAPGFRPVGSSASVLSTNAFISVLLKKNGSLADLIGVTQPGGSVDVRDVARGLVGALSSPSDVGRKRILISGEWFSFRDAVKLLAEVRPELKDRLTIHGDTFPPIGKTLVDNTRAKEVLGLERITPWQETVVDAVDSLLQLEKEWIRQGLPLP